jgi:hypothetical protein
MLFFGYLIYQQQKIIIQKREDPQELDGALHTVAYPFKAQGKACP